MINAVSYQFNKFVEFAEERVKAGKDSAIARTWSKRVRPFYICLTVYA